MSIARHDQSAILSQAVEHGDTVYLAGIVAKDLKKDVKGQTKEILDDIDRLLAKSGSNKSKILTATIWVTHIRKPPPTLGAPPPHPRADEGGVARGGR